MAAETITDTNNAGLCPAPQRPTKKQGKEKTMDVHVCTTAAETAAAAMVRAGVRLAYVKATTGCPEGLLRDLWREAHGRCDSPGRPRGDARSGLKTREQRREAAAFAEFYFAGWQRRSLEAGRFLCTWHAFRERFPGAAIDSNQGWEIIRNICARVTWRETCGECGASFIRHDGQLGKSSKCPFCV